MAEMDGLNSAVIWIIDCACTSHMTFDRSAFVDYRTMMLNVRMRCKAKATTAGVGDIIVKVSINGALSNITLVNMLHIPTLGCQLISVSKITKRGGRVSFADNSCDIKVGNPTIRTASLIIDLFHLGLSCSAPSSSISLHHHAPPTTESAHISSFQLLHERLAHVSMRGDIHRESQGILSGIDLKSQDVDQSPRHGCVNDKGHMMSS